MMELDIIRDMLCAELKKYSTLKTIGRTDLETIHTLSDTIKNMDKIKMLNESIKDNIKEESFDIMTEEDKMVIRRALEVLNK